MNINILHYSLFGIAGDQEVDRNFCWKIDCLKINQNNRKIHRLCHYHRAKFLMTIKVNKN